MNLPVVFLSGADADLQAVFNQFEGYREGFGIEFMTAVDAHLARVSVFPLLTSASIGRRGSRRASFLAEKHQAEAVDAACGGMQCSRAESMPDRAVSGGRGRLSLQSDF